MIGICMMFAAIFFIFILFMLVLLAVCRGWFGMFCGRDCIFSIGLSGIFSVFWVCSAQAEVTLRAGLPPDCPPGSLAGDGVAYVPGIDAQGRPVVPARGKGNTPYRLPESVTFDISVNPRDYLGGPERDARAAAAAAALTAAETEVAIATTAARKALSDAHFVAGFAPSVMNPADGQRSAIIDRIDQALEQAASATEAKERLAGLAQSVAASEEATQQLITDSVDGVARGEIDAILAGKPILDGGDKKPSEGSNTKPSEGGDGTSIATLLDTLAMNKLTKKQDNAKEQDEKNRLTAQAIRQATEQAQLAPTLEERLSHYDRAVQAAKKNLPADHDDLRKIQSILGQAQAANQARLSGTSVPEIQSLEDRISDISRTLSNRGETRRGTLENRRKISRLLQQARVSKTAEKRIQFLEKAVEQIPKSVNQKDQAALHHSLERAKAANRILSRTTKATNQIKTLSTQNNQATLSRDHFTRTRPNQTIRKLINKVNERVGKAKQDLEDTSIRELVRRITKDTADRPDQAHLLGAAQTYEQSLAQASAASADDPAARLSHLSQGLAAVESLASSILKEYPGVTKERPAVTQDVPSKITQTRDVLSKITQARFALEHAQAGNQEMVAVALGGNTAAARVSLMQAGDAQTQAGDAQAQVEKAGQELLAATKAASHHNTPLGSIQLGQVEVDLASGRVHIDGQEVGSASGPCGVGPSGAVDR